MVVDTAGDVCTGTALTHDIVITAAHCVGRAATYRVRSYRTSQVITVRSIAVHPRYDAQSYAASRATADVALLFLNVPLSDDIVPARLAPARRVNVGETLTIAGFGVSAPNSDRGLGVPRAAALAVTGQPSSLQVRLVDPKTRDHSLGLGACVGDSGGPAFEAGRAAIIGIVSWSTGPQGSEGCGGLSGVTPLMNYRGWVVDTARKFGAQLP